MAASTRVMTSRRVSNSTMPKEFTPNYLRSAQESMVRVADNEFDQSIDKANQSIENSPLQK